jgi:hypothetical protein
MLTDRARMFGGVAASTEAEARAIAAEVAA